MLEDTNPTINICFLPSAIQETCYGTQHLRLSVLFHIQDLLPSHLGEKQCVKCSSVSHRKRNRKSEIMTLDSFCEEASSHQLGKMLDEKVNKQHGKLNMKQTYEFHHMDQCPRQSTGLTDTAESIQKYPMSGM